MSKKYNPYIWKLITNDMEFNQKVRNSEKQLIYNINIISFVNITGIKKQLLNSYLNNVQLLRPRSY